MTNYEDLQAKHQQLLAEIEAGPDSDAMLRSVQDYIDQVKVEAENVANPRERDQIRANLRFWAAFVFDRTGTYPSTTLRPPAKIPPSEPAPVGGPNYLLWAGGIFVLVLISAGIYIYLLGFSPSTAVPTIPVVTQFRPEQTVTPEATTCGAPSGWIPYTPPSDDTLFSLAQRTGTSVTAIQAANCLSSDSIFAGQPLYLPSMPDSPGPTLSPSAAPTFASTAEPQVTSTQALRTATVAALLTQSLQTTPTATPVDLYPTSGGSDNLELVAGVFSETQNKLCASETVEVRLAIEDQVASEEAAEAVVNLSQARNLDILDSATISTGDTAVTFDLADLAVAENTSFLLQLSHPDYNASNVIFQFSSSCTNETFLVDYRLMRRDSRLLEQPSQNPGLSLDWRLLTWGPAPDPLFGDESDRWVASIMLVAVGGEGESIFWVEENDTNFKPVLDSRIIVEGKACEESRAIVGLTSGGQSALRELIILSPYCPRELQLDLPDVGLEIIE